MTPEWSRPERLDAIGEGERTVAIEADADERTALARRFGVIAIDRLSARLTVRAEAGGVLVTGQVTGEVVQACSVTDERLTTAVDEPVALRFVPPAEGTDEVELSADALDTIEIEGSAIDLGEAAAETLALAIDPFPRGPNAATVLRQAGVVSEDEARPFNAFSSLKDKLAGKSGPPES
ncbi:YceD family protein [Sphingomonas sp. KR1UV-12]|uniref:YceD family protein n=1 Tax=Sphingomonas aurea TaxID=3063994 RepID=A0ABT9ENR4_9SPHN|nr:YceD family protein [Sphingomonas sp. KR1UV-12]MDP1028600.1 YceD family protein [Sphingomonas sp. KR1UV-12]